MQNSNAPTLYFDGLCPLCQKEIRLLKRQTHGKIDFIDIHTLTYEGPKDKGNRGSFNSEKTVTPARALPPKTALLQQLHLSMPNGDWLIGLDANIKIWSYTRYGGWFKILRWPIIKQAANIAYKYWAYRRYKRQYDCEDCKI